jgi:PTH1 family peptidyl-tRNA hydrolase
VPTRLVVGLGNPGPKYDRTRHNVGFWVVDRIAAATERPWRERKSSLVAHGTRGTAAFALAKPQTFMNDSGRALPALLADFGADCRLLVVCDDFHLGLGRLRCRLAGSDGGQKGLRSILDALAHREVPRLRVGIGEPPEPMPSEAFVLSAFKPGEKREIESAVERASELLLAWIEHGDDQRLVDAANANNGLGSGSK